MLSVIIFCRCCLATVSNFLTTGVEPFAYAVMPTARIELEYISISVCIYGSGPRTVISHLGPQICYSGNMSRKNCFSSLSLPR